MLPFIVKLLFDVVNTSLSEPIMMLDVFNVFVIVAVSDSISDML